MAIPDYPTASTDSQGAALLYTAASVRELDRRLMRLGEPPQAGAWQLMKRAGTSMFHHIRQNWPLCRELLVYCGSGNNGGDGYVIAGVARAAGWTVQLVQVGDLARATPETWQAVEFARQAGVTAVPFSEHLLELSADLPADTASRPCLASLSKHAQTDTRIIVDALLGTGFQGPLRGDFVQAVHLINRSGLPVMAADVPSGLSADRGAVASSAVRATLTVSVVGRKQGLYTGDAADHVGRLVYEPLADTDEWQRAACDQVLAAARLVNADFLHHWLPRRARTAHKGHYGQVLVVGGDLGMGGAPILAAQAAARAGAGKIVLMSRAEHMPAMLARQPEVMTVAIDNVAAGNAAIAVQIRRASVIVLGPGLGQSPWSRALFAAVMREAGQGPAAMVLDADALNLMAEDLPAILAQSDASSRANWILTPHPGEAARLLNGSTADIQQDRFHAVRQLQQLTGSNCLLKGAGSLMVFARPAPAAPDLLDICMEGNPGMATGGMGDVLAGLAGGLLAQGLTAADALRAAVCIHARVADIAVERQGEQGLLASDLFPALARFWSGFNRGQHAEQNAVPKQPPC